MRTQDTDPDTGTRLAAPVPAQQIRRLSLQGVTGAVSRARDFTRQALADWGWALTREASDEPVQDVLLVVSELVANAAAHAGGAAELALALDRHRLTVSVSDHSPLLPTVRPRSQPPRPGGHGLHVIGILATAWGTTPGPDGKSVWAAFPHRR